MSDKYHHGNLKQDIIVNGLKIINEEGIEKLSLRKVSALCGVSHTAAYAHFGSKDDLVAAIKETVANEFAEELERAVNASRSKKPEDKIVAMGRRYVSFFIEKPDYYRFLFENQLVTVHFDIEYYYSDDFPAFNLLKRLYVEMMEDSGEEKTKSQQELELVKIWSSVHGLASIACMKEVEYEGSWEKAIKELIK